MRHTVTGLVDKPVDAQKIIDDLMANCLCDRADIGIMAGEAAQRPGGVLAQTARAAGQVAAAAGTAAATTLDGVFGLGSKLVSRDVSGFGLLSAVGQLGVILSRAALNGAQDLAKALNDMGMESALAREYAEALRQGNIVIVVDAKSENMASCVRKILSTRGAVSPETRAAH